MGYEPEAWHDLFVAEAGAVAALGGLIFVAVSLNLEQVLKLPKIPPLAVRTLVILVGLLLLSVLVLTPGQPTPALGIEVVVLGAVMTTAVTVSTTRTHLPVTRWSWTVPTLLLALVSTVPMVLAGVSLLAGSGGGLYWTVLESCAGISVAVYYAWILLVEIRR